MSEAAQHPVDERANSDVWGRADPTWSMPVPLRRMLVLVPPLLLAGLEIVHPQPDETVQALMDASTWFAGFHVIQLALTGLVGLSVLLLATASDALMPG